MRYLTLFEQKFGLTIEVPGAAILGIFGFDALAFWNDVAGLAIIFGIRLLFTFSNCRRFYCTRVRSNAYSTCGETIKLKYMCLTNGSR